MISSLVAVSLVELLVGLVCLAVAAVSWGHRDRPGGTPLLLLSLSATGWAVTAGLASLVADPGLTRWAQLGTYAFVGPAAVSWFYVVVDYTGRGRWRRRAIVATLVGLVVVEWVLLATDPVHHLYVAESSALGPGGAFDPTPGPLLWVGAVWKVGVVGLGTAILFGRFRVHQGVIRVQTMAVLVAGVLPVAAAILEVLDVVMVPGLDFGVIGVAASAGILLWALFYARFLDIVPVARETLMGGMTDPVVAIDAEGRVVDLNAAAKDVFGVDDGAIGSLVTRVISGFSEGSADEVSVRTGGDVEADGERRYFEINVSPIPAPAGRSTSSAENQIGSLLVFRDVTQRRNRERDLENRNARLEAFTGIVRDDLRDPLDAARERLERAREADDSEDLAAVAGALSRMSGHVEDLLSVGRREPTALDAEPVDLAALVEDSWAAIDAGAATLVVDTETALEADPVRLRALLDDLLRYAVERGGDGVTVGDLADGHGFYLADDGAAADAARLAVAEEIARAHGWDVRVAESASGGARVEFVVE